MTMLARLVRRRRRSGGAVGGLLADPSFDDPAEWAVSGNNPPTVTDGAGVFASTGNGDVLGDSDALIPGKSYSVTFKVDSYTSGNMRIRFGASSSQVDVTISGPGTYQAEGVAKGTAFSFISRGASVLSIGSAKLVRIEPLELVSDNPGWTSTSPTVVQTGPQEFEFTGSALDDQIYDDILTPGLTYRYVYTLTEHSVQNVRLESPGDTVLENLNSATSVTGTFVATSARVILRARNGSNVTATATLSIKEEV